MRANSKDMAFNSFVLNDLNNTIGMKSIVTYIKDAINAFGTNKNTNQFERFTLKDRDKIEDGFQQLIGLGPDGVYKVSNKQSRSDKGYSDQESLQAAVNYLYTTLPSNMKNVLIANTAAEGLDPTKASDVQRLLTAAVIENTSHTNDNINTLSYNSTMTKAAGGGGAGSAGTPVKETREEMIVNRRVTKPEHRTIRGSKNKAGIDIVVQDYGRPMDKSNKQIGRSTVYDMLTSDPVGHNVDMNSISFGGQPLTESEIRRVVYDGTSTLSMTKMPINEDIYSRTGKVVPDLDAMNRYEKFVK